jgi:hypothetical protein
MLTVGPRPFYRHLVALRDISHQLSHAILSQFGESKVLVSACRLVAQANFEMEGEMKFL